MLVFLIPDGKRGCTKLYTTYDSVADLIEIVIATINKDLFSLFKVIALFVL